MGRIKKAQFGLGRLFGASMKVAKEVGKKSIKKSAPAAMSPLERDAAQAIKQIERAEMKKKLQAIERKMQGEDILKSVGKKKQRNGGKVKPKSSNVFKKLGSVKKKK